MQLVSWKHTWLVLPALLAPASQFFSALCQAESSDVSDKVADFLEQGEWCVMHIRCAHVNRHPVDLSKLKCCIKDLCLVDTIFQSDSDSDYSVWSIFLPQAYFLWLFCMFHLERLRTRSHGWQLVSVDFGREGARSDNWRRCVYCASAHRWQKKGGIATCFDLVTINWKSEWEWKRYHAWTYDILDLSSYPQQVCSGW